jgi:probable HAF family extracellular repeat protein
MKNRKLLLLACRSIAALAVNSAHAVTYTVLDLGPNMLAQSLNDSGQVVGYHTGNGANTAFFTGPNGTGVTLLSIPGYKSSLGLGIGNGGQITGQAYPMTSNNYQAFTTGPNGIGFTSLHQSNYSLSVANGINGSGQVSGYAYKTDGTREAFITGPDGVGVIGLGTLGGSASVAYGINNSGQVVGFSYNAGSSLAHAFVTGPNGASMTDLGTLGGSYSMSRGINDAGQVVGYAALAGDAQEHAFVTGSSGLIDLGTLGGSRSRALGINEAGQIVGYAQTNDGSNRAFIGNADGTGLIDLNTLLVTGLINGDFLATALAINERGQIVAQNSVGRSYLLTPVPLPGSAWLLISALGALGMLKRTLR